MANRITGCFLLFIFLTMSVTFGFAMISVENSLCIHLVVWCANLVCAPAGFLAYHDLKNLGE